MKSTYAVVDPPRAAIAEAPLVTISQAELVPVSNPVTHATYGRAIALAEKLDAEISRLEALAGPNATGSRFDLWARTPTATTIPAVLASIGAVFGGLIATGLTIGSSYGIAGISLLGAAAGATFIGKVMTADSRIERTIAQRKHLRIESKQLEPILVEYRNAPADVRAVAHAAVTERLGQADESLSAKAVMNRDTTLRAVTIGPDEARAAKLASQIALLLVPNQEALTVVNAVSAVQQILVEASPSERKEMAVALETLLFASEQPRFRGFQAGERQLWEAIHNGKRGESPFRHNEPAQATAE